MKSHCRNLTVLFLALTLPMAAQTSTGHKKNPPLPPIQVFNAEVQVNGPDGPSEGQDAPPAILVKAGRGADGGVNVTDGGKGGGLKFRAGDGGGSSQHGGFGGDIALIGGTGGGSSEIPGSGGNIILRAGSGNPFCGISCGSPGNIFLEVSGKGSVGIGTASSSNTLEVRAGGTTLADSWSVRSSRRFKNNIQPLAGALEKVEQLQGVSYERKDDGRQEIGVIAEDVDQVVPEVVSRDPETHQVQGVDYSRLSALLIEAVKSQEVEIQQLKLQVEQLKSQGSGK
jgi:hypothetical protein